MACVVLKEKTATGRPRAPSRTGAWSALLFQGARPRRVRRCAADHRDQQGAESEARRFRAERGRLASTCVSERKEPPRKAYDGVAVAAPVTVPYVRYSIRAAHWWLARPFQLFSRLRLEERRGRRAHRVQLHAGARHRHRPHAAPRPLAALARPYSARRRERRGRAAARGARGAGRRCRHRRLHRRRYQPRRFLSPDARQLQPVRARRGLSLRRRRPERELRLPHRVLHAKHGATREDFGKLCVAQRANALQVDPHALFKKP